jgi:hypothetical protein
VPAPARGVGLSLLLQQGVAAWLEAVCTCSSPSLPAASAASPRTADYELRTRSSKSDVIAPDQHAEIATLLASLVLSARPIGRNPTLYAGGYA